MSKHHTQTREMLSRHYILNRGETTKVIFKIRQEMRLPVAKLFGEQWLYHQPCLHCSLMLSLVTLTPGIFNGEGEGANKEYKKIF